MTQHWQRAAVRPPPPLGWPPDDTEESVLGTNLHQATITNLRWGLNEIAAALARPGEQPPWQALSQTGISGMRRRDGSAYTVLPDIFVYARPVDDILAFLPLEQYGPPLLIAKVLSPTTYESNLDFDYGKGHSYAQAGVREYVVIDPFGAYVAERVRGWRLVAGTYQQAPLDAAGRWRSDQLGVAIGFAGNRVVVYAPDGERQLREGEVARELARQREEIAALRRRLDELRGQ